MSSKTQKTLTFKTEEYDELKEFYLKNALKYHRMGVRTFTAFCVRVMYIGMEAEK